MLIEITPTDGEGKRVPGFIEMEDAAMQMVRRRRYMIIRKCCEEDITAVGEFYDCTVKYLCEHINYPKWTYREYPSENSVRQMVAENSQFVCMENDRIVGAFVLNEDPQGVYENAVWSRKLARGEYMICHALASEVSMQGQGVGRRMVEYCLEYARKQGFKAVRLDVVPDNIPAKKLYEKCGFQYVGEADLERNMEEIPVFSMYEINF